MLMDLRFNSFGLYGAKYCNVSLASGLPNRLEVTSVRTKVLMPQWNNPLFTSSLPTCANAQWQPQLHKTSRREQGSCGTL